MGVFMMVVGRHVVLILAKIAPILGVSVILLSFQDSGIGPISDAWRIMMSTALAVFVTLVGAIYQNLNRRLEALEVAAKNDFVPRREYDQRHQDLRDSQQRIEDKIDRMALRPAAR